MTIKNLNNIRLNFKIKTFKLKDEFKISRVSKKIIKVIDISLKDSVNSTTAECVPYQRYNEKLDDILNNKKPNLRFCSKIISILLNYQKTPKVQTLVEHIRNNTKNK